MTQTGTQTETVRGRVEQTNEKGLKVDGRWFNWSQYSRVTTRPQEGDDVELEIARGKFINDAQILDSGGQGTLELDDEDPVADGAPAPRTGTVGVRSGPTGRGAPPATPNADRNTEIRRLALIKAAADYAAARDLAPDEVVTLAARWEEWVTERS
jgi:hypothetical protein